MGLFQPDFIWVTFRSMMPSKYNRTDADIHEAVNNWCKDPATATVKYGHISIWNTSLVTNMKELFKNKIDFNDDISNWNVSSVTDMGAMFAETPFNGDISGWNVSSVTSMEWMFYQTPFSRDISGWNISSVTDMNWMFSGTPFNGDISGWKIQDSCAINGIFHECPIQEENKPKGRESTVRR